MSLLSFQSFQNVDWMTVRVSGLQKSGTAIFRAGFVVLATVFVQQTNQNVLDTDIGGVICDTVKKREAISHK